MQDTNQINIRCEEIINSIVLVEDYANVEWDDKKDDVRILKAIMFKFSNKELTLQGDYMIPLIDVFKGENTKEKLTIPGDEFANDPETKYSAERLFVEL